MPIYRGQDIPIFKSDEIPITVDTIDELDRSDEIETPEHEIDNGTASLMRATT